MYRGHILKSLSLLPQVELAHKVLSKDMSELVHAMKLVQRNGENVIEAEYRK